MGKFVVFGAGGKAGRRVVAELCRRGHEVTAAVRNVKDHTIDEATIVAGDVTDPRSVEAIVRDHTAVINVAVRLDVDPRKFFMEASAALAQGMLAAGTTRLVTAGVGTTLEASPGVAVHDTPDFPSEYRAFSVGHAAELEIFTASPSALDWVIVTPPPTMLDANSPPTRRYRTGSRSVLSTDDSRPFSYADLAVALVDEAETPRHHRMQVAVSY